MTDKATPPEKVTLESLKLSPEMQKLTQRLEKEFKVGEGHQINIDKSLYKDLLPEGLTVDDVDRVQRHHANLAAAATIALGHVAVPYLKKHKDVNTVELTMPLQKDVFEAAFERRKEYPGRGDGAEKIVKWGVVTAGLTVHGAVGSRGVMKKARAYLNDFTKDAIGS